MQHSTSGICLFFGLTPYKLRRLIAFVCNMCNNLFRADAKITIFFESIEFVKKIFIFLCTQAVPLEFSRILKTVQIFGSFGMRVFADLLWKNDQLAKTFLFENFSSFFSFCENIKRQYGGGTCHFSRWYRYAPLWGW